jgi:hypothetical protein
MNRASALIIRFTMVGLFLWFGVRQLVDPAAWTVFLPQWTGYMPIPGEMRLDSPVLRSSV